MKFVGGFEGYLAIGIVLVTILQVKFIFSIKRYDKKMWGQLGKPTLLNPGSLAGVTSFVLFKNYASSSSKVVIRDGNRFRVTALLLIGITAIYLIVPLEIWHD